MKKNSSRESYLKESFVWWDETANARVKALWSNKQTRVNTIFRVNEGGTTGLITRPLAKSE